TISNAKLGAFSKTENRRLSWLIVAAVVIALCDVANAPDALACGAPGQFGGCLAHGQFDSTINESVAGPGGRFHRDTHRDGSAHWYNPMKRTSRVSH
ncbi:MAG: hypothetical protein WCF49_21390, partial [Xanthobacteraceae bacterium]